jgi:hypothetical protein
MANVVIGLIILFLFYIYGRIKVRPRRALFLCDQCQKTLISTFFSPQ